jgi:hypothetical protein
VPPPPQFGRVGRRNRYQRKDIVALVEAIAIAIQYVEHTTKEEWRNSTFTTAAVRRAIGSLLGHFGPPGTPKVPLAIKKHSDYAEISDPTKVAARVGEHAVGQLIFELEARGGFEDGGDPLDWDHGPGFYVPHEWWHQRTILRHLGSGWKRRGRIGR